MQTCVHFTQVYIENLGMNDMIRGLYNSENERLTPSTPIDPIQNDLFDVIINTSSSSKHSPFQSNVSSQRTFGVLFGGVVVLLDR